MRHALRVTVKPPLTLKGSVCTPMGWTGKHSAIRKALSNGAALVVRDPLEDTWVGDSAAWWAEHGPQVVTDDHTPAKPWPEFAYFVPTLWRSEDGQVVLMAENC